MVKGTWLEPILWWLYSALIITGLCIGIYSVGQQVYRQSMDDPQIAMAEDAASGLNAGRVPADVVPHAPLVDIGTSLDPWVAVLDSNGKPLASSATIGTEPLTLPPGLFDETTWNPAKIHASPWGDETRVTWQPNPDIRQAVILVHLKDGRFVAAGRSMRLTEERIIQLGEAVLLGWMLILGATLLASFVGWGLLRR